MMEETICSNTSKPVPDKGEVTHIERVSVFLDEVNNAVSVKEFQTEEVRVEIEPICSAELSAQGTKEACPPIVLVKSEIGVKEEPRWDVSDGESSDTALAALYAGHEIKHDLVNGSESLQPPDSVFATYSLYEQDEEKEMLQLLPVSSDTVVTSSDTPWSSDTWLESSDIIFRGPCEPPSTDVKIEALHVAISNCDVAAVKTLLASGAPITHAVKGSTALHRCMDFYDTKFRRWSSQPVDPAKKKEISEAIIVAAKELNVLDYLDGNGRTPLCVAIEYENGISGAVEALINAGARGCNLNAYNNTALHCAVLSRRYDTLKYFLDNHKIANSVNNLGEAPIHIAAKMGEVELFELLIQKFGTDQLRWRTNRGSTVCHYIAHYNYYDIAQYLFETLNFKENINVVDASGTPLEAAVSKGHVPMAALLLRNGAKLAAKGDKETAVKEIASNFNTPLKFLEDLFDKCTSIYENSHDINSLQIYVGYNMLVSEDMSQIKVLEDFMRFGLSKILKHPTIESLIYFKWRCLLPVFYTIIMTYVTLLMSLNIFVITTFSNIDTSNATCDGTEVKFNATETPLNAAETSCVGSCGWRHWTLVVFIYISTGLLITQECVWIYLQKLHHFRRPETWLKLAVLVLALVMPVLLGCSPAPDSLIWQRHAACLTLLLAWVQAMLLLSRFPGWGYYVLMLERVAINILKILATTIFLVIGFSTCLMIQYQSKPPFDGPVAAFTKTLVMMASEFDYEDLFGEDHDAELKNTKVVVRCLFVVFVIFVAIVLMNFMIGVAVSDVNELNDIGNIRRLEKQVQLLSTLEGLGDTGLREWWPRLRLIRFHKGMEKCLREPGRSWDVYTYTPHPPTFERFTETFSSELHNAILNIAKKNKQNVDQLDAVDNAVVEKSQPNDDVNIESRSLARTLNRRMKSIEDANRELKESMDKVLEMMASSRSSARGCTISSKTTRKGKNVRRKCKKPSTYLIKSSNY